MPSPGISPHLKRVHSKINRTRVRVNIHISLLQSNLCLAGHVTKFDVKGNSQYYFQRKSVIIDISIMPLPGNNISLLASLKVDC